MYRVGFPTGSPSLGAVMSRSSRIVSSCTTTRDRTDDPCLYNSICRRTFYLPLIGIPLFLYRPIPASDRILLVSSLSITNLAKWASQTFLKARKTPLLSHQTLRLATPSPRSFTMAVLRTHVSKAAMDLNLRTKKLSVHQLNRTRRLDTMLVGLRLSF